jgi:hypothetical protein
LRVQFTSSSSKPGLSGGVGGTSFKTSPPGQKNPNHTVQRFTSLFPALEKRESHPLHQIETWRSVSADTFASGKNSNHSS